MTTNRRMQTTAAVATLALAALVAMPSTAVGDARYGKRPVWLNPAGIEKKKQLDPLQFLFMDRTYVGDQEPHIAGEEKWFCNVPMHYYRCRVQLLYRSDWDGNDVPDRYAPGGRWHNHDKNAGPYPHGTDKMCADHRLTVLFDTPPNQGRFDAQAAANGGTGSTTRSCIGSQYHARFWLDITHMEMSANHDRFGTWLLGGFHHEKLTGGPSCCPPRFRKPKHKIDMDWDHAVDAMIWGMHRFCSYRRWGIYRGARSSYQDHHWSKRIHRMTTRKVSAGCRGA